MRNQGQAAVSVQRGRLKLTRTVLFLFVSLFLSVNLSKQSKGFNIFFPFYSPIASVHLLFYCLILNNSFIMTVTTFCESNHFFNAKTDNLEYPFFKKYHMISFYPIMEPVTPLSHSLCFLFLFLVMHYLSPNLTLPFLLVNGGKWVWLFNGRPSLPNSYCVCFLRKICFATLLFVDCFNFEFSDLGWRVLWRRSVMVVLCWIWTPKQLLVVVLRIYMEKTVLQRNSLSLRGLSQSRGNPSFLGFGVWFNCFLLLILCLLC